MSIYKLVLPKMGESVSEATITKWVKSIGESIGEDDTIAEIATDKVDSEVPSPVQGVLKEFLFEEGSVAQVGDVIALIEIEGEGENTAPTAAVEEVSSTHQEEAEPTVHEITIPGMDELNHMEERESVAALSEGRFYSPLVRSIAQQEQVSQAELDLIVGSGADGRVTKQDVLDYIASRGTTTVSKPTATVSAPQPTVAKPQRASVPAAPRSEEHTSELQSRENLVCRLLLENK